MKKLLLQVLVLSLLSASAAFCGHVILIENGKATRIDNAPDPCYAAEGVKPAPVPEEYAEYKDASGIYDVRIYEYTDALVVEKMPAGYISPGMYFKLNAPFFTGKAGKYGWTSLPVKYPEGSVQDTCVKNGVYAERDKLYSAKETADGIRVIALAASFVQPSLTLRIEQVIVDTVTPDKVNGKTLVKRAVVSPMFCQSSNVRSNVDPVPTGAEMLTDDIIRLRYQDGRIEHWKLTLSPEDVAKNTALYKGDDDVLKRQSGCRCLIWTTGAGEGNRTADISRAWNFNGDSSREPVYEGPANGDEVPEDSVAAKSKNVFSGLLARIRGFFKGLFGAALA